MADVFKMTERDGDASTCYYGKVKIAAKAWKRVVLFTDKTASRRRLAELQKEADQRRAGMATPDTERLQLPIDKLAEQYAESLRLEGRDADHLRIVGWMNDKLIELGGWKFFRDITRDSMEKTLTTLEAQGKTASYRNKFIARAKAFVNWALPTDWPSPLARVKRIREKGAKKTRERRAAADADLQLLIELELPDDRRLAYALAAFNGMRRNEVDRLRWDDLSLSATIPFVKLRRKQGETDEPDCIPVHPYVLSLLNERLAMPAAKVVPNVPDVATLEKEWIKAGVKFTDDKGRRLDYHALRHTFQTNLDRTGCSRATKKKLMRHANEDVTDGYAHAELAEMLSAIQRVPSPDTWNVTVAVKTGTDNAVADSCESADHPADQNMVAERQQAATASRMGAACQDAQVSYNANVRQQMTASGNNNKSLDNTRPSTQVD